MRDMRWGRKWWKDAVIVGLIAAVAGGLIGCLPSGILPEDLSSSVSESRLSDEGSAPAATLLTSPAGPQSGAGDSIFLHLALSGRAEAKSGLTRGSVQRLSQVGEPDIPWRIETLLLPPNADLSSLATEIVTLSFGPIATGQSIPPVSPPIAWREGTLCVAWPRNRALVDGRDMAVYGQDAFWPAAEVRILDAGRLRKWRLVRVAVPQVQYNPVRGEVRPLAEVSLSVKFARRSAGVFAMSSAEMADRIGEDMVRDLAANFDSSRTEYGPAAGDAQVSAVRGYAIITTAAIQNASTQLAAFVALKQSRGFTVQVVTESQFGGGTGDAAANNIRAWLQNHYATDHLQYVLLIGNPNPTTGDVPMKMLWPRYGAKDGYDEESPSDFFYSDLTGNWDRDGDGYFGEYSGDFGSGGIDRYAEVWVGRIPHYGSIANTDAILAKLIAYQSQSAADAAWRRRVLLPMEPSDTSTPGYHLGEQIKNSILIPQGWGYHRVYEQNYGLTPPPETTPCDCTNVKNVWSATPFGLVTWWTHGSATGAVDVMSVTYVPYLNDSYPSFTFQCSCTNARPETANNLAYSLLQRGAINTVAASRVSWYYPGQTYFAGSCSNAGMAYEYTRRVVVDNMTAGRALADLRQTLAPSQSALWMNFTDFNIYGDPDTLLIPVDLRPPEATDGSVQATSEAPISVTLSATDDGLPNPPGALSYVITSLPAHGTLQDPAAGFIGAVPYVLAGGGEPGYLCLRNRVHRVRQFHVQGQRRGRTAHGRGFGGGDCEHLRQPHGQTFVRVVRGDVRRRCPAQLDQLGYEMDTVNRRSSRGDGSRRDV